MYVAMIFACTLKAMRNILFAIFIFFINLATVRSKCRDRGYNASDPIPLYATKVGPINNPSESYRYYDLPFCAPGDLKEKKGKLGDMLNGDCLVSAPYKLEFLRDKESVSVCKKNLSKQDVTNLRRAVKKHYYFQMYYDDIPISDLIGIVEKDNRYLLYTKVYFDVFYNKDSVIQIKLRSDPNLLLDLTQDEVEVEFSYTVKWTETDKPFYYRRWVYWNDSLSWLQPHYDQMENASVIFFGVTMLLLMVSDYILRRRLRQKISEESDMEDQKVTGWKCLHGDVFRFPKFMSLFTAAIGCGCHLHCVLVVVCAVISQIYCSYNRADKFEGHVTGYIFLAFVAGYCATRFYVHLGGKEWVRNMMLTGCLFGGPLFLTFCFLETVAIAYKATASLPFVTIVAYSPIYVITLFCGSFFGYAKKNKDEFEAPTPTSQYPREIPPLPWYLGTIPQMIMAGFLPFSAIYIELYYIFDSLWGHRIYYIFFLVHNLYLTSLFVTVFVTPAFTYFQLAAEDHEWWWRSFLCGGSTGLYMFCYTVYYYFAVSDMSGFLQTSFYFGYMTCLCYGLFLMLGAVGFCSSFVFVHDIYKIVSVKLGISQGTA